MDARKLAVYWWRKQGLDGSALGKSPQEVLERSGWARSVGGANPYITLFSRARTSKAAAEQATVDLQIHELPSARGCTYSLPASDFALGLRVGEPANGNPDLILARKISDFDEKELEKLCEKVESTLEGGPLDPKQIKDKIGDAVRNFGDEGKKRGLTTSLPIALGVLQTQGRIRRIPADGRLDQQRFKYALWRPSPLAGDKRTRDQAMTDLARRYFDWTGVASIAHFQWFSGLSQTTAKVAIAPLGLEPLEPGSDLLTLPSQRTEIEATVVPSQPYYNLVTSLDSLFLLRRDLMPHIAPEDGGREWPGEKGMQQAGSSLFDLPCNAIVDRGYIVGVWEYDPNANELVWATFRSPDSALLEEIKTTEAFIREELGDCRSFSLDSPSSRAPKIELIRRMNLARV